MNQGVRPEKTNEPTNKEDDGNSFSDKPDTAWNAHFKRNNSMLVKMFHGQMVSRLTCQGCHKVREVSACALEFLYVVSRNLQIKGTLSWL